MMSVIFVLLFAGIPWVFAEDPVELKDPIYQEYQKELDEVKKALEAEKKVFETHEASVKAAIPQTGQIKYAMKRYYESLNRQQKLKQLITYHTIKLNTQKYRSRLEAKAAKANEKPWPDPERVSEYIKIKNLRQKIRPWSVEERQKELGLYKKPNKAKPKTEKSAEAPSP